MTLLHHVSCLRPGWSKKTIAIECLVDAGADLSSKNAKGQTPLMMATKCGSTHEKNIRKLIELCSGTEALNEVDNEDNNVLHVAASLKQSAFSMEIVKVSEKSFYKN